MYRGRILEIGTAEEVLAPPHHPYTRMLLDSAIDDGAVFETAGAAPAATGGDGCVFAMRCPRGIPGICDTVAPPARRLSDTHVITCHRELEPPAAAAFSPTTEDIRTAMKAAWPD
jgi:peptide/nickel transport system ATP-binding protein